MWMVLKRPKPTFPVLPKAQGKGTQILYKVILGIQRHASSDRTEGMEAGGQYCLFPREQRRVAGSH